MKSSLCAIAIASSILCSGAYGNAIAVRHPIIKDTDKHKKTLDDIGAYKKGLSSRKEMIVKLQNELAKKEEREKVHTARQAREVGKPSVSRGARMEVPSSSSANTGAKTYMDYRAITSRSSPQYKLQHSGSVYTDSNGLRRHQNGDYIVALGSYYGGIGDRLSITFESGHTINVMIGDRKADRHTDSKNQHKNGNIVEFIVDTGSLQPMARRMGDISHTSPVFQGRVTSIVRH